MEVNHTEAEDRQDYGFLLVSSHTFIYLCYLTVRLVHLVKYEKEDFDHFGPTVVSLYISFNLYLIFALGSWQLYMKRDEMARFSVLIVRLDRQLKTGK